MKVNEMISVLFYLNSSKKTKDGLVPIYVRMKVNGQARGIFIGQKDYAIDEQKLKEQPQQLKQLK